MMGETAALILLFALVMAALILVPALRRKTRFLHRAGNAKTINTLIGGAVLLGLSALIFSLDLTDAKILTPGELIEQMRALLSEELFWLAAVILALNWVCGGAAFKLNEHNYAQSTGEITALSVVTVGALFLVLIALPGQMGLQSLLAAALVPALVLIAVAYGTDRRAATGAKDILPLSRVILFLTLLFLGLILAGLMSPLFAGMFLALCLGAIGYETSYETGYKKSIALIAAPIAFSFALLFCVVLAAQIIYTLFDLWGGAAFLQTSLVKIGAGLFMALAGLFLARFYHPLLIAALLLPLSIALFAPPLLVALIFSLWLLAAPERPIADMRPAEKYVKAAAFALGAIALLWPQGALWLPRLIFG